MSLVLVSALVSAIFHPLSVLAQSQSDREAALERLREERILEDRENAEKAAELGSTIGSSDPTVKDSSGSINTSILGGAAQSCVSALLANTIVSSLIQSAGTSILSMEVPVADTALRKKEVGVSIFGFSVPTDGLAHCLANATIEAILQATIQWV